MKKAIQHIQWFILGLLIIVGGSCNLLTNPDDQGMLGKNVQISDCGGFDAILIQGYLFRACAFMIFRWSYRILRQQ